MQVSTRKLVLTSVARNTPCAPLSKRKIFSPREEKRLKLLDRSAEVRNKTLLGFFGVEESKAMPMENAYGKDETFERDGHQRKVGATKALCNICSIHKCRA